MPSGTDCIAAYAANTLSYREAIVPFLPGSLNVDVPQKRTFVNVAVCIPEHHDQAHETSVKVVGAFCHQHGTDRHCVWMQVVIDPLLRTDPGSAPVSASQPTVPCSVVTLTDPRRPVPLDLRVAAPIGGGTLPVVLLSRGHGPSRYIPSKDGYGPLVEFYAGHGFIVIQPAQVNSKVGGVPADAAGGPLFWRSRVEDMSMIIDQLDAIDAAMRPGCYSVPALRTPRIPKHRRST